MERLFHQSKLYVKEIISFQSILTLIIMIKKKAINTIVSLRTTINGNINVICYNSNDVE